MTAPLIDSLVEGVANRPAGTPPADAVVRVLVAAIDPAQLADFRVAEDDAENRITAVLAREAGGAATPVIRAQAIQLVGLVRLANSEEVRLRVAAKGPAWTAANELKAILWSAAEAVKRAY